MRHIAAVLLFSLAAIVYFQPLSSRWPSAPDFLPLEAEEFKWDSLVTKPYLDYTPCYDSYQCARLELPMDYWNGTTNATISLAVIRKPAVVPVTDPRYGGAVLHNPGGPGGSGVDFLQRAADPIRKTIDSEDGKAYDLISFDPRAVGRTLPAVQCFNNLRFDQSWQVRVMEEGVFEASNAALGRLWSMAVARGQSCSLAPVDGGVEPKKYVTTAYVARDMLELVERHGEWRHKEAERLLQGPKCGRSARLMGDSMEVPESIAYKPGEEKIQYWGFSYGTYLGNTFAAMFPDRVHRLIVDGVVDAYNYKKTLWSDNLLDTEKDMDLFYYHCARVGYPTCALANETGETKPEDVEQRLANLEKSLYHNPLPVVGPIPEVITYSDIKNLIFASLYSPIQGFPYMANLLAALEKGDGTEFAKLLKPYHDFSCPAHGSNGFSIVPLRNNSGPVGLSYDATMAIACSDGDDQSWVNKTEFAKYEKKLAKSSPNIGSMWSTVRMLCIHYNVRPVHRFEGPWVANTSHPLLMIGNTADPVTPVKHARNMAKGFEGAVALTQDSAGHCSSSTYSKCTKDYIRRYFQTGELPPVGTVCSADEKPFGPGSNETEILDAGEMAARQASAGIAAALHSAGGHFMRQSLGGEMSDPWLV